MVIQSDFLAKKLQAPGAYMRPYLLDLEIQKF